MARTSNTMLNRSSDIGHPCLALEFSGKVFSFSTLSIVLAVGLSKISFVFLIEVQLFYNVVQSLLYSKVTELYTETFF